MEMRWGIVEWRLHVYGWVILCLQYICTYEFDLGSEENQQQMKENVDCYLPSWE